MSARAASDDTTTEPVGSYPGSAVTASPVGVHAWTTVISFRVSVPVLSVHTNVVDPSVSTASRFRTSTRRSAMRSAAQARLSVTVGRRASGTSATVTPMPNTNPSDSGMPRRTLIAKNDPPTPTAIHAIVRTTRRSSTVSGLAGGGVPVVSRAMSARRVDAPVARTTACASPPRRRSPRAPRRRLSARTVALSPVSSDVSSCSAAAATISAVSRDAVTRLEQEEIADDHVDGIDHGGQAVPSDRDLVREQVTEPLGRARRLRLLPVGEHRVEEDHQRDRDAQLGETTQDGEQARAPEQEREEVDELADEPTEPRWPGRAGQLVGPVDLEAPKRLAVVMPTPPTWAVVSRASHGAPSRLAAEHGGCVLEGTDGGERAAPVDELADRLDLRAHRACGRVEAAEVGDGRDVQRTRGGCAPVLVDARRRR